MSVLREAFIYGRGALYKHRAELSDEGFRIDFDARHLAVPVHLLCESFSIHQLFAVIVVLLSSFNEEITSF